MTIDETQNKLDNLYNTMIDKKDIKNNYSEKDLASLSAPFILQIPDYYYTAKKKILYVGKETNIWWGKLGQYVDVENSLDILKRRYKAEFEGGDVETSKDLGITKSYKAKDWGSNAFFSKYTFFEQNIQDSSVIWTNLLKIDSGVNGYSKNSINDERIKKLSRNILLEEIKILKPDAIVFVTATSTNLGKYDSAIKETFDNKYTNEKVIKSKELWIFEYKLEEKDIKCYRTLHPLSYQYKKKEFKENHYKTITDDINNDFKLFNN